MLPKLSALPWYGLAALTGIAAAQPSASTYESVYTQYTPYREESLLPWRNANEAVARVGGHAGIFGGAMHQGHDTAKPSDAAGAGKPPAPAPSAPAGGRGHH